MTAGDDAEMRGGRVASSAHEERNAKESLQHKRAVKVSLSGRSTGMGAYTQQYLYSIRQQKRLEPHHTEWSRTGRHWEDIYYLLPGKYFLAIKDISNSGKHYCRYALLRVFTPEEYREKVKNDKYAMRNFDHYYRNYGYEIIDLPTTTPPAPYVEPPCSCLSEETAEY